MCAQLHPTYMAELRLFRSSKGPHLFVTDGSRIYDIDDCAERRIAELINNPPQDSGDIPKDRDLWDAIGVFCDSAMPRYIDKESLSPPPLRSISLNVAQACNMGCGYCYADTGKFGGSARIMNEETARIAVDRLIAESSPKSDIVVGFMGGEPLLNRRVVHQTTRYAARVGREAGRRVRFSITTNATTLQPEDAELFAQFPYTVTISIDGKREQHDEVRRMNDGSSSYSRLLQGLDIIARHGRPRHLSARVTVTPRTGDLLPILDHALSLGFDEVGFAAALVSADPSLAFSADDFQVFLERMVVCGRKALQELSAGRKYPFGNFETALEQIHRGSHRPYPCGAGAAYLSANAEGKLYACHRLIDDPKFEMGSVRLGSNFEKRAEHLSRSHVDLIEPCRSCWARYLCGGGCYHEVSRRGRLGCDYIRGWLEFCLYAYAELSSFRPNYFNEPRYVWEKVSNPTTISN